ncbi:hypothetical protein BDZ94DRAFT_1258852 [Collybia nuda]|uniref:Uncharacterized protein n=1 Tax=Collybia nuda TaxID=64659 RepID=A0A9P5Y764_9AGAR|nr:hypothetical protein BDZ94DRAFT_1258852 [Collybia nuda]
MRFTAVIALFALVATPALAMYGAEEVDARDLSYEAIDARDFNYNALDTRDFGYDELDARDFGYDNIDARGLAYDEIDVRDFGYDESQLTAREIASAMVDILQERGLTTEDMESRGFFPFTIAKNIVGSVFKHKVEGSNNNNNKKQ